jgi:hypothetical protein
MDLLDVLGKDLRCRQLNALRDEMPEAFEGHDQRMSKATVAGVRMVHELAGHSASLQALMGELVTIAERDPRFAFLDAIPEGPILSMTRALALERSVFGVETRDVAELSLLMGLFTVILDGLLDEAPAELQPSRAWLDSVMEPTRWAGSRALPELASGDHPVIRALGWTTREVIHHLVVSEGWLHDGKVREQFSLATRAAYSSEIDSADCRITGKVATIADSRRRILAKSTNPIWAGSLIPFCVHGFPERIDPETFADVAKAIGAFGGWLDDVVDIAVDLRADRWSMVLLELYDIAQSLPGVRCLEDPRPAILSVLSVPFIAGQIASFGISRLETIRSGLRTMGIAEADMLPAIADVAQACLTVDT